MAKLKRGEGSYQKVVGDAFETKVLSAVLEDTAILGLKGSRCLQAAKTEGSRGEMDIVVTTTKAGKLTTSLIQAKRNGYVHLHERNRIMTLVTKCAEDNGSDVRCFLAYHTTEVKWACDRILTKQDLGAPKRYREWENQEDESDDVDVKFASGMARMDSDFEMLVANGLRSKPSERLAMVEKDLARFSECAFCVRLEEADSRAPNIYALLVDPATKKLANVYCYVRRNPLLSGAEIESIAALQKALSADSGQEYLVTVAYYMHGKLWLTRVIRDEDDLEWFRYA